MGLSINEFAPPGRESLRGSQTGSIIAFPGKLPEDERTIRFNRRVRGLIDRLVVWGSVAAILITIVGITASLG